VVGFGKKAAQIVGPERVARSLTCVLASTLLLIAAPGEFDRYPASREVLAYCEELQMKIAIGSDHAGFTYKEKIKQFLSALGHEVADFGTYSEEPVDYPLFIRPVAEAVARGETERGVVLGGSGNGEAMAANRVKRVRCALCWNVATARLARQHNDANIISLGQRMLSEEEALEIVRVWLETGFEGGRHLRRIQLLDLE
jgi:ribose 5-phosphate isomerase B